MDAITITITPRHSIFSRETILNHYSKITNILGKVIYQIRKPGGKRYAASTQHTYAQEMFRYIKEIMNLDLYKTQQGRVLMKILRIQSFLETNKAPAYELEDIIKMYDAIAEDRKQFELMLIAFATAARIGDLEYLINRGEVKGGWRVTWAYHKSFHAKSSMDVLIPIKCIPKPLLERWTSIPLGPVCTAEERENLYATMKEMFEGRTYCIRRSALQHFRYNLKMTLEEITPISLHSSAKTLHGYLSSAPAFE